MLPKKVFYIWNYLEWGGAQVYFFGLMNEMKNYSDVLAIMPSGSNEQLLKFLHNLQIPCEFFDSHTDTKPAPTFARKLQRHWNKIYCEFVMLKYLNKFDFSDSVIHIEIAPWQSLFALLWLCRKAKVFVTVHNSILPIPKHRYFIWLAKFGILARMKNFHIFTANNDARESLKMLVPEDFFQKIKVTHAYINPQEINQALQTKINRNEMCEKYNLPKDKFLVFCVGQFIDRKGRWIFLEAAAKLKQTNDDIAFVWISNSKPSNMDLEKAKSFGLGEDFVFITSEQVGREHKDLFNLLRVADVFSLPSYIEGLPISLLEAMALGIPSVSTDINGIPEAIKHLETGYLIAPGAVKELKNAIQTLKDDSTLRERLSKNGREFILTNFSEEVVAKIAAENYIESFDRN